MCVISKDIQKIFLNNFAIQMLHYYGLINWCLNINLIIELIIGPMRPKRTKKEWRRPVKNQNPVIH